MNTIKIYGKTGDEFNRYLSEKTMVLVKEYASTDATIEFYDMDRDIGLEASMEEGIKYVPTVIITEDNEETEKTEEVGVLVNDKYITTVNMAHIWWTDLILLLRSCL